MEKYLKIEIKKSNLVLSGSINAEHTLDFDSKNITINLSNGTNLIFRYSERYDYWMILNHNLPMPNESYFKNDDKLTYKIIPTNEYGVSESIIFNYAVSNALIKVDDGKEKRYGQPILSKDQELQYNELIKYLTDKGIDCDDKVKTEIKLILTNNYN